MKVYIGYSLASISNDYVKEVEDFQESLSRDPRLEVFTSKKQEHQHAPNVMYCDVMIAVCSEQDTELGIEIGYMLSRRRPLFMVSREEAEVTKLERSLKVLKSPRHDCIAFKSYSGLSLLDTLPEVMKFLEEKCMSGIGHALRAIDEQRREA